MKRYNAIGLMSGSSLDGVDIAYCEFTLDSKWSYRIIYAETIPYPEEWKIALIEMPKQEGGKLVEYDISYGKYLGQLVNKFKTQNNLNPDLISSHGHTVFHNPELSYTFQLGNGQAIASMTGIKTICDFRNGDIQLGGQGAPLVPIGDNLLFSEYDFCINIGGIANISYELNEERIAYDICPANQVLNYLSMQVGEPYDKNGNIAQLGKMNEKLFKDLNNHPYYSLPFPKSMSNQLVTDSFIELINSSDAPVEDCLYTFCKHIAYQINNCITNIEGENLLISGGGAHNGFLTTAISKEVLRDVVIPDIVTIDFKEAMVFAFMGILRVLRQTNCLASATGATRDSSSGVIYLP